MRLRAMLALLAVGTVPALARAQPGGPYEQPRPPQPPPSPVEDPYQQPRPPPPDVGDVPASRPGEDPVLAEQIAVALVGRAQELFDAKVFRDAKQLAVEAMVQSPRGAAAEQAKFLIKAINEQLGTSGEPGPDKPAQQVDLTPIRDPLVRTPVAPPTPEGMRLVRARTILSGVVWGGAVGGLFADSLSTDSTTAGQVFIGAAIGGGLGGLGGFALARKQRQTRGDLALIDTLAGMGLVGGLTVGMAMQPVESEAYSVNAIIGVASGLLVGYVAAPQTNTTERRMVRVAGMAAVGGGIPFLLYAGIYDSTTDSDERLVGALSTAGLVIGAYVGLRLTRHLDEGRDVLPGDKPDDDDAPLALVGRHSDGRWTAGALTVQPLSRQLAPQPGLAVPILGAAF